MDVVWSKPALTSLSEVIDYTYDNFGKRQVSIIAEKIDKTIERLSVFPFSAQELPYNKSGRNLRFAVVVRTLKVLYEVDGNTLKIHYLWNSNMDIGTVLERIWLTQDI